MGAKLQGITPPFIPIGGVNGLPGQRPITPPASTPFREILESKLQEEHNIRFSAHARARLESREISLDAGKIEKLAAAIDQVHAKGGHDSLILMENLAFIVNADRRTVVTAMEHQNLNENVFTKIDSAVIIQNASEENAGSLENSHEEIQI